MLEIVDNGGSPALLKVFGVGGGGSNAVNRMIQAGLKDVEFWVSNTDLQALERSACHNRLPLGKSTTRGLGAGGDPEIGALSAEEDAEAIERIIEGSDMIFITAGMGGGTGTGAAPVIARIARELGILTVGIVTKPFTFEGKKKLARARRGLEALAEHVDTLISIPNDKLMQIVEPGTSFEEALLMADEVLFQATRGISDLIMGHGIINLDFADVRTVMRGRGNALLGSGSASGENRALEAAQKAVSSPLLEDLKIDGAAAVLINIQGGPGMGFHEAAQAAQFVSEQVGEEADVFWGAVIDPTLSDDIRVTLVATGFPQLSRDGSVAVSAQTSAPDVSAAAAVPSTETAVPHSSEPVPEPVVESEAAHLRPAEAPVPPTTQPQSAPVPPAAQTWEEPTLQPVASSTPTAPPRANGHQTAGSKGNGHHAPPRRTYPEPDGSETRLPEEAEVVGQARLISPPPIAGVPGGTPDPQVRYEPAVPRQPGGRLPERERVSNQGLGRDDAFTDEVADSSTSDPSLGRSRWARKEGEEVADEAASKQRLDIPTFLRKRIID